MDSFGGGGVWRMEGPDRWRVLAARLSMADRSGAEVLEPSVEQLLGLFARLSRTGGGDLYISGTPGERMLVVGGGPSRYLAYCIGEGYGAYNLVDPAWESREGWLTLNVGGVDSAAEEAATVGPELAEQAIRYFHACGSIDPQLRWE